MRFLRTNLCTLFLVLIVTAGCSSAMDTGEYSHSENRSYDASAAPMPSMEQGDMAGATVDGNEGELEAPETNEGDKYEAPGTNPYVVVGSDPLSTFAVDVDTASYDIFRRDLGNGYLPQEGGIRLEEFVNYFAYDYSAPEHDSEIPFAVTLEAAANPFVEGTTLLSVGIKGKAAPPEEKKPANLVFLVDISGSMSGAYKLPLVKRVLTETLDILDQSDTVSIVTYAGSTGVKLEPTPVSDKTTINDAINSMNSGGSTAGGAGIQLAYEQAAAGFVEGGINHVLLCTDGDFNVGISGDGALVELIEEKRKTGITLTVLGFGTGNLNDSMMEKITNAGNGVYGVIATEDQAVDYVHKRLLSAITYIAKDVKIQVEFNADKVYAYRLLGYENRAIADHLFKDDTVDAGEIGSGHTVTALYELVLVGDEIPEVEGTPEIEDGELYDGTVEVGADDIALVKIRYKEVDATEDDQASQIDTTLSPEAIATDLDQTSWQLQWASSIAAFAEILKDSPYADAANLEAITEIVEAHKGDNPDRVEFAELLSLAIDLLNAQDESELIETDQQ